MQIYVYSWRINKLCTTTTGMRIPPNWKRIGHAKHMESIRISLRGVNIRVDNRHHTLYHPAESLASALLIERSIDSLLSAVVDLWHWLCIVSLINGHRLKHVHAALLIVVCTTPPHNNTERNFALPTAIHKSTSLNLFSSPQSPSPPRRLLYFNLLTSIHNKAHSSYTIMMIDSSSPPPPSSPAPPHQPTHTRHTNKKKFHAEFIVEFHGKAPSIRVRLFPGNTRGIFAITPPPPSSPGFIIVRAINGQVRTLRIVITI